MIKPPILKILVIKYLTDTISDEELKTLQDWSQHPENQKYFKAMVRTNQNLDFTYDPIDIEHAYQKVIGLSGHDKISKKKHYRAIYKYAAVAVVLITMSFGIYSLIKRDDVMIANSITETAPQINLKLQDGTFLILDENSKNAITNMKGETVANQEYGKLLYEQTNKIGSDSTYDHLTVPLGKRFELKLSDGSVVYINAGSQLKYPQSFIGLSSRGVYLEGEAFFDVKENKSKPFIVHTKKMNIRVFGTKFNVSSYQNENETSAVLTEGSIAVYDPSKTFNEKSSFFIKPGQQVITKENGFVIREVNTEKHIAWSNNQLYFSNDRFGDIIKELERHYNIRIENKSLELNDLKYTGTFSMETISQVLNTFQRTTPFEYQIDNGEIIIKVEGSKQ
ncbi:MAG: hypothetical protein COC08_06100 [Maribacter sp.]|nr:MAG: hypothetical protein COC08_06100 [Maribacter sp.]